MIQEAAQNHGSLLAVTAGIGALVGLGKDLASPGPLSWRQVVGRSLVSAGLGAASGAILIWIDGDVPPSALYGLAAALSSLGTDGVSRLLGKVLGGKE